MNARLDETWESLNVSRETIERLELYEQFLLKWTQKINLISKSTLADLWTRHFLDSAQLVQYAPEQITRWVDLGSGAGFPGAVVAILLDGISKPEVVLIESDKRKAAFLKQLSLEVGVDFKVIAKRIDDVQPLHADVVSARALSPLPELIGFCERHLAKGGLALFLKGEKADHELVQAKKKWRFRFEMHDSVSSDRGVILKIGDIHRV